MSEVQLFVVLLACVVLQSHARSFATEVITIDGYGAMQIGATVLIAPVTTYVVYRHMRELRELRHKYPATNAEQASETMIENPLSSEHSSTEENGE